MSDDNPIREWVPYDSVDMTVLMLAFETEYEVGGPQDQLEIWQKNDRGSVTLNKLVVHLEEMQRLVPKRRTWAKTLWGRF